MSPDIREPDVLSGAGSRKRAPEALEANDCQRAFIIASASVADKTPLVKDVESALGGLHAGTHVGIGQHAPADKVKAATEAAREAGADGLVSIGGGSVIDAAKFVAVALAEAGGDGALPPHVALPTTLSGAEFTLLAGRTTEGPNGRPVKTGMGDPSIIPTAALLDPEACTSTPRWLWAATGIRAVDHAIEGITSPQATKGSDERCLRALERFATALPASVNDADDLDAHLACLEAGHDASAGINYAASGAGLSHKLGKAIGSTWDVPHGVTSAHTLPAVVRYEAERQPDRVRLVAEAMGREDGDAAMAVNELIGALGIQRKPLKAYGIKETDVPWIVEYALGKRDPAVERLVLGLL